MATHRKPTIPVNPSFNFEYKGYNFKLTQQMYLECGDIPVHIPYTIYSSSFDSDDLLTKPLSDRCQKGGLANISVDQLDVKGILICDVIWEGCTIKVVPNIKRTVKVQTDFHSGNFYSLDDYCWQYSDNYPACYNGDVNYVRACSLAKVNDWLSGNLYTMKSMHPKWEHLDDDVGASMQDFVVTAQRCMDDTPKKMVLADSLARLGDHAYNPIFRQAIEIQVKSHNEWVDRFNQM